MTIGGRKRGGDFIFDQPPNIPAVWGEGENVLWAEGEGFMIASQQGLGKSTTAQQLILRRVGLIKKPLLGLPVTALPAGRRVLYLAMDRPRQIGRSMKRMVNNAADLARAREALNRRLVVWNGPLPVDFLSDGEAFVDWANEVCPKVSDIVVDSLKDFAVGLSDDKVAAATNLVWQQVNAAGLQLAILHHDRKSLGSEPRMNPSIDDIYGGRWITAGMGSIIMFSGSPGDQEVTLHHVKQPSEVVGPMVVCYDRRTGDVTRGRDGHVDHTEKHVSEVVAIARAQPGMPSSHLERKMTTVSNNDLRHAAVVEAEHQGLIYRVDGPKNAKLVYAADDETLPEL